MNTSKRIDYVDRAKGLLIILVVVGHVCNYTNPEYRPPLSIAQGLLSSFHMPAFFIISGILTNKVKICKKRFNEYILAKCYSLVIPYFFFEVLAIIYKHFILQSVTIQQGLVNTFTVQCNIGADWFLPAMFIGCVILYIMLKIKSDAIGNVISIIALFSSWILPKSAICNCFCRGLICFSFIWMGYKGKKFFTNNNRWMFAFSCIIWGATAALQFLWFSSDIYNCEIMMPPLFLLSGLSGTYVVLYFLRQLPIPILQRIGRDTLTIMGTHQLILYTIPASSTIRYVIVVVFSIIVIETFLVFVFNRFVPFLIGKDKLCKKNDNQTSNY